MSTAGDWSRDPLGDAERLRARGAVPWGRTEDADEEWPPLRAALPAADSDEIPAPAIFPTPPARRAQADGEWYHAPTPAYDADEEQSARGYGTVRPATGFGSAGPPPRPAYDPRPAYEPGPAYDPGPVQPAYDPGPAWDAGPVQPLPTYDRGPVQPGYEPRPAPPGYSATPPYGTQPGYGAPPPYAGQPQYGGQPTYDPPPQHSAPPNHGAQPGYGTPAPYGAEPGYGQTPRGYSATPPPSTGARRREDGYPADDYREAVEYVAPSQPYQPAPQYPPAPPPPSYRGAADDSTYSTGTHPRIGDDSTTYRKVAAPRRDYDLDGRPTAYRALPSAEEPYRAAAPARDYDLDGRPTAYRALPAAGTGYSGTGYSNTEYDDGASGYSAYRGATYGAAPAYNALPAVGERASDDTVYNGVVYDSNTVYDSPATEPYGQANPAPYTEAPPSGTGGYRAAEYRESGYDNAGYDNAGYDSAPSYDSTSYDSAPAYDTTSYDSAGYDNAGTAAPGYEDDAAGGYRGTVYGSAPPASFNTAFATGYEDQPTSYDVTPLSRVDERYPDERYDDIPAAYRSLAPAEEYEDYDRYEPEVRNPPPRLTVDSPLPQRRDLERYDDTPTLTTPLRSREYDDDRYAEDLGPRGRVYTSSSGRHRADGEAEESERPTSRRGATRTRRQVPLWQELPLLIIIAFSLALVIKTFLLQAFFIPSGSMENTLLVKDRVLVNKVIYEFRTPQRGEVIVFKGTDSWAPETDLTQSQTFLAKTGRTVGSVIGLGQPDEKDFIKRVIGVPGDVVQCCDAQGRILVNGKPMDEDGYVFDNNPIDQRAFGPITVPQGRLFMMGDHRGNSQDSRAYIGDQFKGTIPINQVIGRAFVKVWPVSSWNDLPVPDSFDSVPSARALPAPGDANGTVAPASGAPPGEPTRIAAAVPADALGGPVLAAVLLPFPLRRLRRRRSRRRQRPSG